MNILAAQLMQPVTQDFRFMHVVSGENDSCAGLLEFSDFTPQQVAHDRIKSCRRFMQDEKLRFAKTGPEKLKIGASFLCVRFAYSISSRTLLNLSSFIFRDRETLVPPTAP